MSESDEIDSMTGVATGRRVLFSLGFIAAVYFLASTLSLDRWLDTAGILLDAHPVSGRLLFVAIYVVASVVMIPGSILTLIGGYLFGFFGGLPLIFTGVALGVAVTAKCSRLLARSWVATRIRRDSRYVAIDHAIVDKAFMIVALSRLSLLIPYNFLNVIYGMTRIPLSTLTVASVLGMIPAITLYTYLGSATNSVRQLVSGGPDSGTAGAALLTVGLVSIVAVTVVVHRAATSALQRELESRHADDARRGTST